MKRWGSNPVISDWQKYPPPAFFFFFQRGLCQVRERWKCSILKETKEIDKQMQRLETVLREKYHFVVNWQNWNVDGGSDKNPILNLQCWWLLWSCKRISASLGNTQHSTQWWQAMTYAAYLYGSEKNYMWAHVYVSTGTCVCVCAGVHTDRKDKWGTMLTTDESDRCIYLSISVKLSPNIKTEKELPDVTKPCEFFQSPPPWIFSCFLCPNSSPLFEIPPLLIHSFSLTCRIFKLEEKEEELLVQILRRLNWKC